MSFPTDDACWASTVDFIEKNRPRGAGLIGPVEFADRISDLAAAWASFEQPLDRFPWLVVHKGRLEIFEAGFLQKAADAYRPVFANEVFVILAANGGPPSLPKEDVHVGALHERVASLSSNTWDAGVLVKTRFELQPYVSVVSDYVLRADPRDRLNQLCDISDWRDGPMTRMLAELHAPVLIHRKDWECGKCLTGLDRLGMIRPDVAVLSVGAGMETPLFYFANHVKRVVAADLYSKQAGSWCWGADCLDDPSKYAPFPYRKEALEVFDMSGLDLRFPNGAFDVVYTLSSIEHFGGHDIAAQAMREMARVTKPGGVVCVVTELLLSTDTAPELFTLPDLREFIIESSDLRLIEPDIDLRISESVLAYPSHLTRDPANVSPHIVMTGHPGSQAAWTSVILFFRKPV